MPYASFLNLLLECQKSNCSKQWQGERNKYNKKSTTPITLLLLCLLRYLGCGWTFDDLQESTSINPETIRNFLHKFLEFGSTTLYKKYVRNPIITEDVKGCEAEFLSAGFPGCIGSTDATHIVMEICSYRLRQLHLGYKLPHTARIYNMTVNHRRGILKYYTWSSFSIQRQESRFI